LVTVTLKIPLVGSGTNLADVWRRLTTGPIGLIPKPSDQIVTVPSTFTFTTVGAADLETLLLELDVETLLLELDVEMVYFGAAYVVGR
jgi:hypothetical protein